MLLEYSILIIHMRLKFITALGLFFIFTLLFATQIALANHETNHLTTGPVTGPVTGPATLFKITGKVTYHFLGMLQHGMERFMPASGVHVKAVDIFNHHTVTTTTDAEGNYTLMPGQKGFYKVTVWGGDTNFYVPPVRFVNDK